MKNKTAYWAVTQKKQPLFQGSFTECWDYLLKEFGNYKLKDIAKDQVKIGRNN